MIHFCFATRLSRKKKLLHIFILSMNKFHTRFYYLRVCCVCVWLGKRIFRLSVKLSAFFPFRLKDFRSVY